MDGVELIRQERQRQIEQEGWSPEHDDQHNRDELSRAAQAYLNAMEAVPYEDDNGICSGFVLKPRKQWPAYPWPWEPSWWKPSDDPVRNLVKSGALIAAEIDRLNRLAELEKGKS